MSSVRAQRNNNIQPVPSTDRPTMSKGTRFVTFAVPAVIAYFLLLLHVLPTPFLAQETADQILPVVRCPASCRDRDHVLLRSISGRDGDEVE